MARTKPPKIAFKFAEASKYSQKKRECAVDLDKKGVNFRFSRWDRKMTVSISREDFDDFLTWFHMADSLEKAHQKRNRLDETE